MQAARYHEAIEAAGFHVKTVRENTAYRFVSNRAADATTTYGVTSISLLAHRT
jgi:arsenite methyltransferase